MAPVIKALRRREGFAPIVCSTGQHREILDQMMAFFGIKVDIELNLMQSRQSLTSVASTAIEGLGSALEAKKPDWTLVQGDTTTALSAALAGFYSRIRIGHVEAGLRTSDKTIPYPEELNRRLISQIADLHFAPSQRAHNLLLKEGHDPATVTLAGNTVIDALHETRSRLIAGEIELPDWIANWPRTQPTILMTMHRRESFDGGIERVCRAMKRFAVGHPEYSVIFPIHPNPLVSKPVRNILGDVVNIHLTDPVGYPELVGLLDLAKFIVTDSGGIQEEAAALGRPIIILRDETERPEVIENGNGILVGTHEDKVARSLSKLAENEATRTRMSQICTAYGEGRSSELIVDALSGARAGCINGQ